MKPSKDLEDACIMTSAVLLILVSTSKFTDPTSKHLLLGILIFVFAVSTLMRIVGFHKKEDNFHYD